MNVGDICNRHPVTVFRNDTVGDACRLMRENPIGSVVVIEDNRRNAPDLAVMAARGITRESRERVATV